MYIKFETNIASARFFFALNLLIIFYNSLSTTFYLFLTTKSSLINFSKLMTSLLLLVNQFHELLDLKVFILKYILVFSRLPPPPFPLFLFLFT